MVFGWIVDAVSSVCSAVGSAFSSVVEKFTDVAKEFVANLAPIISAVAPVLNALSIVFPQLKVLATIVNVLDKVFTALGLSDKGVEETGQDVLDAQDAGIHLDDYESYDDYKQAVDNFRLENPDKRGDYSQIEKVTAGMAVLSWGMEEKFGPESSDLVTAIVMDGPNLEKGEGFFTPERTEAIVNGVKNIGDVAKYFSGKLSVDEKHEMQKELIGIVQKLEPETPIGEIRSALAQARQN
ncbi:hypothetical protein [Moraxella sp.]|uniref:hypothetical protein n=1 Tax=Moraxella sp. TaxID=479 RepID=UPI0026DC8FFB|nr:hypothetical protein [Moraxella sp.]MDO4894517.1 hypothetical protein [Moraxella sp.]